MLASHRIRLDPAPAQAAAFHRRAGHARTAYHWAVRALRAGLAAGEWRDAKTLRPMFNAVMGGVALARRRLPQARRAFRRPPGLQAQGKPPVVPCRQRAGRHTTMRKPA